VTQKGQSRDLVSVALMQFTTLMKLLHKMLNQVDADRRHKMMREAPDDAMLQQRR